MGAVTPKEAPRGGRVLIVEDDAAIRGLVCDHLTLAGFAIDEVADGRIRRCWMLPLDAADSDAIWSRRK